MGWTGKNQDGWGTGAAAPVAASADPPAWNKAGATVIGTDIFADSGDNLVITLPDGTSAFTAANGIAELVGALVWDLGTLGDYHGSLSMSFKPVSLGDEVTICMGIGFRAGGLPASMVELVAADHQYAQMLRRVSFSAQRNSLFSRGNGDSLQDNVSNERTDSQQFSMNTELAPERIGTIVGRHTWPGGGLHRPLNWNLLTPTAGDRVYAFLGACSRLAISTGDRPSTITMTGRSVPAGS